MRLTKNNKLCRGVQNETRKGKARGGVEQIDPVGMGAAALICLASLVWVH